jgi:hypothetical protein
VSHEQNERTLVGQYRGALVRLVAVLALTVVALGAGVPLAHSATTTTAAPAYDYDGLAAFAQGAHSNALDPAASSTSRARNFQGVFAPVRFVTAVGVAAEELPDATIIVRGGESELPPAGEMFSGSQGQTLDEAAAGVRHGTIRSTTAGDIRAGGGTVRPNPEFDARVGRVNHQHVDVCLGAGSCPFSDPFENPVPKSGRFGFPNYPYDRWGP